MAIEINYELEPKDLTQYYTYIARQQKTFKPMVIVFAFVFITFLLADFIYAIFSGQADIWSFDSLLKYLLIRLIIVSVLLGFLQLFFYLMQLKSANYVSGIEGNGLICRHKIVLNEKELIEITNVNSSRHSWSSVEKIEEIENFILITINSLGVLAIPKRYFQDREHINNFLQTADYYRQNASSTFHLSYLTEYEKSLQ